VTIAALKSFLAYLGVVDSSLLVNKFKDIPKCIFKAVETLFEA